MTGKPYVFHSRSVCAECGATGDDFGSVNVEAFEVTGELVCEECARTSILARYAEDFPTPDERA